MSGFAFADKEEKEDKDDKEDEEEKKNTTPIINLGFLQLAAHEIFLMLIEAIE